MSVRFKVVVTRVDAVEHWVRATDEEDAVAKVEAMLERPYAFIGRWETQATEVRVVETEQPQTVLTNGAPDTGGRLLGLKDAAAALGISYSLLYSLVRRGEIESTAVGSRKYISRAVLDAFVERNTSSKSY